MTRQGKRYGAIVIVFVGLVALALPGGGQAQQQEITGKDGAPMVLVPAGEFTMGDNEAPSEKPVHQVSLDAYYMDKHEVTVEQYAKFLEATKQKAPPEWKILNQPTHLKHPVVMMDWSDANRYCLWAEKRLPTEAEWEKAARGTDGRKFARGVMMCPHRNGRTMGKRSGTRMRHWCRWGPWKRARAPTASTIWPGMPGNGSATGMTEAITRRVRCRTRRDRSTVTTKC